MESTVVDIFAKNFQLALKVTFFYAKSVLNLLIRSFRFVDPTVSEREFVFKIAQFAAVSWKLWWLLHTWHIFLVREIFNVSTLFKKSRWHVSSNVNGCPNDPINQCDKFSNLTPIMTPQDTVWVCLPCRCPVILSSADARLHNYIVAAKVKYKHRNASITGPVMTVIFFCKRRSRTGIPSQAYEQNLV